MSIISYIPWLDNHGANNTSRPVVEKELPTVKPDNKVKRKSKQDERKTHRTAKQIIGTLTDHGKCAKTIDEVVEETLRIAEML